MARKLGEVGIAVEVRPFEFALFLDDVKKGNFQLCSLQMSDIVEPDMMRALFHATRVPTAENGWAGANRFRYRDGEVDRWLDAGAAEAIPPGGGRSTRRCRRSWRSTFPCCPFGTRTTCWSTAAVCAGWRCSRPGASRACSGR